MAKSIKAAATSSIRSKSMIVITVFVITALFSIAMSIYDISNRMLFYGILFGLAAIIFIMLTLLKINSTFGTYIKVKDDDLYMKSWVNDFLPYEVGGGLLSDLKPSKTKLTQIPPEDITMIVIGTKEFVKRSVTPAGKKFIKAVYPYEHSSNKSRKHTISSMDLFYLETVDNDCCFMCIHGFDPQQVTNVIDELYEINPDMYVKVGSRAYRRPIAKLQSKRNLDI